MNLEDREKTSGKSSEWIRTIVALTFFITLIVGGYQIAEIREKGNDFEGWITAVLFLSAVFILGAIAAISLKSSDKDDKSEL